MSDAPPESASGPRGLRAPAVPCAGCGTELDGLRAGHVAIIDAELRFFCNFENCRVAFLERPRSEPTNPRVAITSSSVENPLLAPMRTPEPLNGPRDALPPAVPHNPDELIEPVAALSTQRFQVPGAAASERDAALLLVALTLVAGLLGMALELADSTKLVRLTRLVLIAVGTATIAGHTLTARGSRRATSGTAPEDPAYPHWMASVAPPALALSVAVASRWALDPASNQRALFVAATIVTVNASTIGLTAAASRAVDRGRQWIVQLLESSEGLAPTVLTEPGRAVLVSADEIVPVDFEVTEGDATVLSWVVGAAPLRRRAGDVVVAGTRILTGQLRGVCTFAGDERALSRGLLSPLYRPDVHAETPRQSRRFVERWSVAAALGAAALQAAMRGKPLDVAMVGVAVYAALASISIAVLPSLSVARSVLLGLDRGIVFRSAEAWDRAARATAAVFCARGTLLRGEPELSEIELFGHAEASGRALVANDVLTIAAAALSIERHPVAWALKRAAKERGLARDLVRNGRSHEGRGVTGIASNGEAVCVGTRDLMMERRISVAVAEDAMTGLESAGRTVILVARSGRLLGLCGLQDGLRTGARAAVQHLLDVGVEPVLMSSDTSVTCEALGRALDIDHLRPEVRDDEQGAAIARLRDAGAIVAVLGHTPLDGLALKAADVGVVMGNAGRPSDELGIATVMDDVRDAAVAIALAHQWRKRTVTTLGVLAAPAVFGSMVVSAGLLSPEYAPIAQLFGTIAAVWQLTREDSV